MKLLLSNCIFLCMALSAMASNWSWVRSFGGLDMDAVEQVAVDNLGNVYISGEFYSSPIYFQSDTLSLIGDKDCFLAKLDKYGNEKWVIRIGSSITGPDSAEAVSKIIVDPFGGGVYLSGSFLLDLTIDTTSVTGTNYSLDYFIAKIDSNGNCKWISHGGGIGTDGVNSFLVNSDGNIIAVILSKAGGILDNISVGPGLILAKLDQMGVCYFAKSITYDAFGRIDELGSDYIIAGFTRPGIDSIRVDTITLPIDNQTGDKFCARFDSSGNVVWAVIDRGTSIYDYLSSVVVDDSNNIYTYGQFTDTCYFQNDTVISPPFTIDVFLCKRDEFGNVLWVKTLQASGLGNAGRNIALDSNRNIYITGTFSGNAIFGNDTISSGSGLDMFLAGYNPLGQNIGVDHIPQTEGLGISIDRNDGSLYITGGYGNSIVASTNTVHKVGMDDGFLIKHTGFTTGIIEQRVGRNNLFIYANPTTGSCTMKLPEEFRNESILYLTLIDSQGRIIESRTIAQSKEMRLNLSAYSKGLYYVTLSNGKSIYKGRIVFE